MKDYSEKNCNIFISGNRKNKGVTLIELLVAIFLFTAVILMVTTLFTLAIRSQRRALALAKVQENTRFLLEFVSKELRMGTITSSTISSITITRPAPDSRSVTYGFSSGSINRTIDGVTGIINSDDITVNGAFYVTGLGDSDDLQPKVTITLTVQGKGTKIEESAKMNIQTTLSQRLLDI